jgi:uncharacterized protein involved in exopolysaccharide biosynthesis
MRPTTYTSRFSFLPQGEQTNRAGLAGLAGQFGISLGSLGGEEQPPQFYADLLSTRGVLQPIAMDSVATGPDNAIKVPLAAFLRIAGEDSAYVVERTMRKLSSGVITTVVNVKTGVIGVEVKTASPYVSLAIAARLIERLNHFNLITRQSRAREERRFTESRLAEARAALRQAEDNLLRFTQSNRDITNSNTLTLQRARFQREVDMHQQIVTSLAQQYEENRIREVRDTPVLTLVEAPVRAARRDARHGALLLFLAAAGALGLGVLFVVLRDGLLRERSNGTDPALELLSSEWRSLRRKRSAAAS